MIGDGQDQNWDLKAVEERAVIYTSKEIFFGGGAISNLEY